MYLHYCSSHYDKQKNYYRSASFSDRSELLTRLIKLIGKKKKFMKDDLFSGQTKYHNIHSDDGAFSFSSLLVVKLSSARVHHTFLTLLRDPLFADSATRLVLLGFSIHSRLVANLPAPSPIGSSHYEK